MNIQFLPYKSIPLDELREAIDFVQREVTVYGKSHPQPRLTKWYGPVPYRYSGLTWEPCPMPALLEQIRGDMEALAGTPLNSVLCNLYRDGSDCVGWHADDEPIFGGDPVVTSLSFGATRRFKVRSKANLKAVTNFNLTDGSLLIMGRGVQRYYQHSIPRTKKPVGPRINLTFRQALGSDR